LDANGDVKIGDFGLATRSDLRLPFDEGKSDQSHSEATDMTTEVGTSFYIAPELLSKDHRGRYNQKVDMYSLGIIFFECVYFFSTGMERSLVLRGLRKSVPVFPADFDLQKLDKQAHIIKWLLDHQPKARPTAIELLQSEYLPPKIEDEFVNEALRTIANPNTPYYRRLMDVIFGHSTDKHADFTFDFNSGHRPFEEISTVLLSRIKELLVGVFEAHGAVEVTVPLLIPRSELNDFKSSVVRLVGSDGSLVELPHDLTLPFARHIARNAYPFIKRWSIERVYRSVSLKGFPPSFMSLLHRISLVDNHDMFLRPILILF
jgi:translation initiation factor 2-alpha kinase 4